MKGWVTTYVIVIVVGMLLTPNVSAVVPTEWEKGQEEELLGHTFEEDMWTNDNITIEHDGGDARFAMSYVQEGDAQAFLIAFRDYTKDNNVSTLPYQLFGMHYWTPGGHEVFLGAVLAFLMTYNDSYNGTGPGQNMLPDPGNEETLFAIPFGIGEVIGNETNETYAPEVDVIDIDKDGHTYTFGMRYRNLYAVAVPNQLSIWLATGYIVKFSELTITYEVTFGEDTIRAETFYEIGQVTELWGVFLGIPFKLNVTDIPDTMGISVVHYVSVFTSKFALHHFDGNELDGNITDVTDDLEVKVGESNERAFKVGYRGTYDLIDETNGTTIGDDIQAYNMLVAPRNEEFGIVRWQAGFSLGLFTLTCYAMTDYYQTLFKNPQVFMFFAAHAFKFGHFWYAVAFPEWNGYRIEHDPVYTAYISPKEAEDEDEGTPGFEAGLIFLSMAVVIPISAKRRRRTLR